MTPTPGGRLSNTSSDPQQGYLRVRLWHRLHFRTCATVPMSLILLKRFDEADKRRSHPL